MASSSNIGTRAGPQHSQRLWRAIGLMSGTSLDGIDVAMIGTDGREWVSPGRALTLSYPQEFRERLRSVLGGDGPLREVEEELTRLHAEAVEYFLCEHPGTAVDVVGFHGHTILHCPAERRTWQIGNGALLAHGLGLDVVADFRSADVERERRSFRCTMQPSPPPCRRSRSQSSTSVASRT